MKYSFNWIGDQIRLIWGVLRKIEEDSTGGGSEQESFNRIPSATYSELGITPESTIEEKQIAISNFLEGYNNDGKDVLFFEIKDNTEPETNTLKIIDLTNNI